MTSKEKFKCDYCPSVLGNKYSKDAHMKRNKSCLKIRNKSPPIIIKSVCVMCGFLTNRPTHVCRIESIEMVNKIKILNTNIDKINNDIKANKFEYKDIISDKNDDILKLNKKLEKYELIVERLKNENFNLDRDYNLTIDELKAELKEYKLKIFDIASKPSNINNHHNTTSNTTNNTNNIQMLIQKLVPISEHEMIKLFETVCTKETILNGVDTLMEELGLAMKNNHMLCTDTNRNKLTYKNEENEVIKDTNGKVILPQLCKWGQISVDKGYLEAEKVIKERTNNEDEYDSQMRYLDKEWQYKYPRIKSGIGEKESKKAAKILSEKVKVTE
jgi:hypothetical protein